MFRAIRVTKRGTAQRATLVDLDVAELVSGDVTVAVEYSTINYKDALALTGKGADYPCLPPYSRH
jgi:acrylyl-CoA reductase (NADPH)